MDWTIQNAVKKYSKDSDRIDPPEVTVKRIEPLMESIGVTELEDCTGLDRLGIPCYTAIRPRAAYPASGFYCSAGSDPLQARLSVMMTAIERFSGEYRMDRMEYATREELGITRCIDPHDLILPRPLEPGEKIHWTSCFDLMNHEEVYVPSNAVFHPYDTLGMTLPLFQSDPVGLACGNVKEEAILHGMLEVLERDAISGAERKRDMGRRLEIDGQGAAGDLLDRYESAGIQIHLWLVPGRTKIPVVAAAADDTVTKDPGMLVMGSSAHLDPRIAVIRALLDIARNRRICLQRRHSNRGREVILGMAGYERMKRINREWFVKAPGLNLSEVPSLSTPSIDEDIGLIIRELGPHVDRICVCDLTRTIMPAVRTIVPGLEVSSMHRGRVQRKRG
ncbi:MAG: YcaO-like family protein [Methanolinea sp.]|nr:YcaO-like family protein [Methanolinea sp.]